jgi:glycosyltransferase involved in cell wall biosynthesis
MADARKPEIHLTMRALVIAPEPFFTPRGTPLSVYHRTAITAELGVEIDLLTYGQGQDVDLPGVRIIRIPDFPFLGEVPTGPSYTKFFLDLFLIAWAIALLLRNRYDMVHAHEEAIFFCLALKPLFRFRLVYDMHSSLPQQLVNFRFTSSRLVIGAFDWLERRALANSDAIITICPDLADYVAAQQVPAERHFLIENSILDPVRVIGEPDAASRPDIPLLDDDSKLVIYAGTLEAYQGIDLALEAVRILAPSAPELRVIFLGGTPDQVHHYRNHAKEIGVSAICTFAGRVPQETARSWISRALVQISPRISGTNTPLKVYEQLASGVALVATNIYSHTQVLDDRVALLVEPEPGPLAAGLARALDNPALRKGLADRAQSLYAERYSRKRYRDKMVALLGSLD